jgi:RNA polymerase sigma factor (sigma-70 family)
VIGRAHATHRRRTPELDLFRLYLDEIGRHPLLTAEDEVELSRAYRAGLDARAKLADADPQDPARPGLKAVAERGEWARRTMIEANLRLVVSIARRFSATGLPLGDLVQEGNLGLLRAVELFDGREGFRFSTYATAWIKQAIARGAADRGARAIRLPVHIEEQVGRLRRTRTRMHEKLGASRPTTSWPRNCGSRYRTCCAAGRGPGEHLAGHPDRGRRGRPAGPSGGRLGGRPRRAGHRGDRPRSPGAGSGRAS